MSGFDWVIAVVFLLSIVIGILRGFIREALSVTSWILAIWLALTFSTTVGDYIGQYINIPAQAFRTSVGFGAVFVGTLFFFSIVSYIVSKLLVKGPIKGTDRILGIFFGAARAAGIIVVIILLARGLGMNDSDWWKNSKYLSVFEPAANYFEQLLPAQLQSTDSGEQPALLDVNEQTKKAIQNSVDIEAIQETMNSSASE